MILSSLINQFGFAGGSAQEQALMWLTQTTLIVGLLIAFILVIRKPIARMFGPQTAYFLWSLPLLRFAMPELAIIPQPESQPLLLQQTTQIFQVEALQAAPEPVLHSPILFQALLFIWISCAVVWFCAQLAKQKLFSNSIMENSKPAPQSLLIPLLSTKPKNHLFDKFKLNTTSNHEINIRIANDEIGPLVTGLINPVIILPKSFMEDYSQTERTMALTHELIHIQRGDLWITLGALFFRALQWPNPIVHLAWRHFRADQESSCDALVLQKSIPTLGVTHKTHTYASAIVKAVKKSSTHQNSLSGRALPAHTLGLPLNHEIKERLMLMKSTPSRKRRLLGAGAVSTVILASLAATAQYGYAAQKETKTVKTIIVKSTDGKEDIINVETTEKDGEKKVITTKNGEIVVGNIVKGNATFFIGDDELPSDTFTITEGGSLPDSSITSLLSALTAVKLTDQNDDNKVAGTVSFVMKGGQPIPATSVFFMKSEDGKCKAFSEIIGAQNNSDQKNKNSKKNKDQTTKEFIILKNTSDDGGILPGKEVSLLSDTPIIVKCDNEHNFISKTGNEAEALRSAIENLKEQEERNAARLDETRKWLEKRLEELEKAEKK